MPLVDHSTAYSDKVESRLCRQLTAIAANNGWSLQYFPRSNIRRGHAGREINRTLAGHDVPLHEKQPSLVCRARLRVARILRR